MASAPGLTINLPGSPYNDLPTYASAAALRSVPSSTILNNQFAAIAAGAILATGGIFRYSPSSTADDDGITVIRPSDLTPLQAGRWLSAPYIRLGGDKGDPGGNAMAIGLFTQASGLAIPTGTDLVQTSGYTSRGVGAGLYVYDPTIDAAYVAANPRIAFLSANGRGFRLTGATITATMLGAVGDGVTDDAPALAVFAGYSGILTVPDGNYVINSNIAITADLSLANNVTFTIGSAVTELRLRGRLRGASRKLLFAGNSSVVRLDHMDTDNQPLPEWWGAGAAMTSAQNDAAFAKWRVAVKQSGGPAKVKFPLNSAWVVNSPGWMLGGITQLEIDFNGSTFRNDDPSGGNGGPCSTNVGCAQGTFYAIASASAGDTSITTLNAADAGNFVAGQRLFLAGGLLDYGGYPIPARAFDFALRVVSVNTSTGVIQLADSLLCDYDQNWIDVPGGGIPQGKPRITALDTPTQAWGEKLILRNGTMIPNGTGNPAYDGQLFAAGYRHIILDNMEAKQFCPSFVEYLDIENCRLGDITSGHINEWDRCVRAISIKKSVIRAAGAWGMDTISIEDSVLIDVSLTPRKLRVRGGKIVVSAATGTQIIFGSGGGGKIGKSFDIADAEIEVSGASAAYLFGFAAVPITFQPNSATLFADHGEIVVTGPYVIATALAWTIDDGSILRDYATGTKYRVRSVHGTVFNNDGSATLTIITSPWRKTPTTSTTLIFMAQPDIRTSGLNIVGKYADQVKDYSYQGRERIIDGSTQGRVIEVNSRQLVGASASAPVTHFFPVNGVLRSLRVLVTQAYTGASGQCKLQISGGYGIDIGMTVISMSGSGGGVGSRVISDAGVTGFLSGDTAPSSSGAVLNNLIGGINLQLVGDSGVQYVDTTQLPQFTVYAEYLPDSGDL